MDVVALIALTVAFGTLYGLTLFTGPDPFGDRTKFMFLGKVLGISHPSGFPLYMFLNHLVSDLPIGLLAVRENALSAVLSIGVLCFVYGLARVLSAGPLAAFGAAALLGVSPTFWRQAIVAEVYALHALLVAAVCLTLILWQARPARRMPLYGALLLLALAAANHPTAIALIPPVLFMLIATDKKVLTDWKVIGSAAAFLTASLATYAYLMWRTHAGGPHLEFHVHNLGELINYVTGSQYRTHAFLVYSPSEVLFSRIPSIVKMIWQELGIGVVLAGIGVFAVRPRSVRTYLVLVPLSFIFLIANYNFRNREYLIAVCIPLVVLVAVGVSRVGGPTRKGAVASAALIAVCVAITGWSSLGVIQRDRANAHAFDHDLLGALDRLGDEAFLMLDGYRSEYGEFEGLSYYVWGEGRGGPNVFVSTYQPVVTVARYILRRVPFTDPVSSRIVPPGLRVFASSPAYCRAIAPFAVTCRSAGPGLVELLPASPPPA